MIVFGSMSTSQKSEQKLTVIGQDSLENIHYHRSPWAFWDLMGHDWFFTLHLLVLLACTAAVRPCLVFHCLSLVEDVTGFMQV